MERYVLEMQGKKQLHDHQGDKAVTLISGISGAFPVTAGPHKALRRAFGQTSNSHCFLARRLFCSSCWKHAVPAVLRVSTLSKTAKP